MVFPDPPMNERDGLPELPPMEAAEAESLETSILHRIGFMERLQHKVLAGIFSAYGLHPSQGLALKTIIRAPGMSQRELADRLRIQRATITVMLQKLERGDFIRREPDPFDQRVIRIFPTQKGEAACRFTDEACNDFFRCCFSNIDPRQQEQMMQLLGRMEENMFSFEATLHNAKEPCP